MVAIVMVVVLAVSLGMIFEKRIYETLPVAVFATALGVYCFALLLPLSIAVLIVGGLVIIALGLGVFRWKSKGGRLEKPVGLSEWMPYIILAFVCALLCNHLSGRRVFFYDDLSYWAIYTKNIFAIDKLPYLYENCSISYKDYTPIMQILQYIALFGRKMFDESMMFRTNVCFIYVLLLPLLGLACNDATVTGADEKGTWKKAAAIVLYVIFPHILTSQFYYRLGVDLFLALVFGYALYYIWLYKDDEVFRMVCMICSLAFLALIKSSGIVLCIFALLFYIIYEIGIIRCKAVAGRNEEDKADDAIKSRTAKTVWVPVLLNTVILCVFTLGSYFSWQLFLRHSGNNGYLSNRVKDGVTGGGFSLPEYAGEVTLNYIKHFFTYPLTGSKIGVTAFILVVFITCVFILQMKSGRASRQKPSPVTVFICAVAGLVIFCIAHLSMYLFVFDDWEAHGLLEFDRYITQYLGGIFFLYCCALVCQKGRFFLTLSVIMFLALLPYGAMKDYLLPTEYEASVEAKYGPLSAEAEDEWARSGIAGLNLPHDGTAKLLVVADAWDEKTQFFEYVAVPQPINQLVNVPGADPGTINGFIMDFVDEYVYVCENAPASYAGDWNETAEITVDGIPLVAGGLYTVERSGDDKLLSPFGTFTNDKSGK